MSPTNTFSCTYNGKEIDIGAEINDDPCKKCTCLESGQVDCKDVVSTQNPFNVLLNFKNVFCLLFFCDVKTVAWRMAALIPLASPFRGIVTLARAAKQEPLLARRW